MSSFNFYISQNTEIVYIKNSRIHFEEHCHTDNFVFTLILKGSAELSQNKRARSVSAGGTFCVAPYRAHSLVSEERVELLSVCINKRVIFCFPAELWENFLNGLLSSVSKNTGISGKPLAEQINKIYAKYHGGDNAANDIFKASRESLIAKPESEKTVEEYAKEIYVSKFYYIRKIKEVSGLTPRKLIIQSRIRKAQALLHSGTDISQTALITGFYDQSHFNKYFKKIVGIPPLEYLRSLSNFLQD